jgi:hypothetical protein
MTKRQIAFRRPSDEAMRMTSFQLLELCREAGRAATKDTLTSLLGQGLISASQARVVWGDAFGGKLLVAKASERQGEQL